MKYEESISYLESFWKFGIKLGLSRINHLLEILGDPHKKFKSIHVAGTNGKGSVCAMTASVLKDAGYKTGLYISPHLLEYTERIKINRKDISRTGFSQLISKIKKAVDERYSLEELPTEFELLTAAAFLHFAEQEVDIAVIETGLGGRLDSTNVITPVVTAITNVDLDHCSVLGDTIAKIAREKAGIIKPGIPLVTASERPDALKIIRKECARNSSKIILCSGNDPDIRADIVGKSGDGQIMDVLYGKRTVKGLFVPLFGAHQSHNVAVVFGLLSELRNLGFHITENTLREGLSRADWPARFQVINKRPLVILDGAHNPAGIKALLRTVSDMTKGDLYIVAGILKDKDLSGMMGIISRYADTVIAVAPDNPRACAPEVIASEAKKHGLKTVVGSFPDEGLKKSLKMASSSDVICVCGSLFTCADVLRSDI